jgi:hypothetical protein
LTVRLGEDDAVFLQCIAVRGVIGDSPGCSQSVAI